MFTSCAVRALSARIWPKALSVYRGHRARVPERVWRTAAILQVWRRFRTLRIDVRQRPGTKQPAPHWMRTCRRQSPARPYSRPRSTRPCAMQSERMTSINARFLRPSAQSISRIDAAPACRFSSPAPCRQIPIPAAQEELCSPNTCHAISATMNSVLIESRSGTQGYSCFGGEDGSTVMTRRSYQNPVLSISVKTLPYFKQPSVQGQHYEYAAPLLTAVHQNRDPQTSQYARTHRRMPVPMTKIGRRLKRADMQQARTAKRFRPSLPSARLFIPPGTSRNRLFNFLFSVL